MGEARYGLFNYGDLYYGEGSLVSGLAWALEVGWNGGVRTGDNEALYMTGLRTRRGRQYVLDARTGIQMVQTGEFEADILDADGRYNPFNSSSPIYPYCQPGAPFWLWLLHRDTAITYPVMTGYLSSIKPYQATTGGVDRVRIRGEDAQSAMRKRKIRTAIQTSYRTDQALAAILSAMGWTWGSDLDDFTDTMAYWWGRGRTAIEEISDLCNASMGNFFLAGDGQATYYSRLQAHTPVAALTEADIRPGIELLMPWETQRNDVTLVVNTRTAQAAAELWRMSDKPQILAGGSLEVWADYRYDSEQVPALNVVSPVATTDYTANSLEDGSGSDLTANFSVTADIFGETCKLTIANNGAVDGYVTLLKVRGEALTSTPTKLNQTSESGELREMEIDSAWLQSVNLSNDILKMLYQYVATAQIYPQVKLRDQPALQFGPDLFDFVTLNFPAKSIAGDYALGWIEHQWLDATGQLVETTFRFEPPFGGANDYWVFPAQFGRNTRLAG